MNLNLHRLSDNIVQVRTDLTSYTVIRDGETVTLLGQGLEEEFDLDLFPSTSPLEKEARPRLLAIASYLIASIEASLYGD
jgi:hypothetical protein